eukprot:scaffold16195_cov19-Tisochrysis_lutea.AAC.3
MTPARARDTQAGGRACARCTPEQSMGLHMWCELSTLATGWKQRAAHLWSWTPSRCHLHLHRLLLQRCPVAAALAAVRVGGALSKAAPRGWRGAGTAASPGTVRMHQNASLLPQLCRQRTYPDVRLACVLSRKLDKGTFTFHVFADQGWVYGTGIAGLLEQAELKQQGSSTHASPAAHMQRPKPDALLFIEHPQLHG